MIFCDPSLGLTYTFHQELTIHVSGPDARQTISLTVTLACVQY